jgi:hypothetical protein
MKNKETGAVRALLPSQPVAIRRATTRFGWFEHDLLQGAPARDDNNKIQCAVLLDKSTASALPDAAFSATRTASDNSRLADLKETSLLRSSPSSSVRGNVVSGALNATTAGINDVSHVSLFFMVGALSDQRQSHDDSHILINRSDVYRRGNTPSDELVNELKEGLVVQQLRYIDLERLQLISQSA